ncbi:hypothetical protein SAMN02745121_08819 [Nannocystis exedens]|uniref:Lipoprotein n=1 Tax=Nannocystis exedens TaxID=54 RepID=A0A1I2IQG1_9BACT|nr:hypothetical protein [Nannocystis exedens]PCC74966.1 hypothetical protein NAEX_08066 [Nannocystis exedens]SFF43056.1 hypothetical protein SAMN02745121_08819 [Nannocystis exedens]
MTARPAIVIAALLGGCVRGEPASVSPAVVNPTETASAAAPAQDAGAGAEAAGAGAEAAGAGAEAAGAGAEAAGAEQAEAVVTPEVRRGADGGCEPTPKAGDPCRADDGYCVLSWGEPGGYSEALWCRDGRWALEQERNLP